MSDKKVCTCETGSYVTSDGHALNCPASAEYIHSDNGVRMDGTVVGHKLGCMCDICHPAREKKAEHGVPIVLEGGGQHAPWCGCKDCHEKLHDKRDADKVEDMFKPVDEYPDTVDAGDEIGSAVYIGEEQTVPTRIDEPSVLVDRPDIREPGVWPPSVHAGPMLAGSRTGKTVPVDEAVEDPWKHRSQGMVCATCMWCVMKQTKPSVDNRITQPTKLGRCRRRAPTMNGYPAVFEQDWCGDHKLDENKL